MFKYYLVAQTTCYTKGTLFRDRGVLLYKGVLNPKKGQKDTAGLPKLTKGFVLEGFEGLGL